MWTVVLLLVCLPDLVPEPVLVPAGCEFSFLTLRSQVPRTACVCHRLYGNPHGRPQSLAEAFRIIDGSLTWTMRLRTGVNTAEARPHGALQGVGLTQSARWQPWGAPGARRQSLGRASSQCRCPFTGW